MRTTSARGGRRLARELAIGYLTGTAGTAAMTLSTALQRRVRSVREIPVDYDATSHVVDAAGTVIGHRPQTTGGEHALFALTHWGYGSAMAVGHRALVPVLGRPRAAVTFYVALQTMAFLLFPTIGRTPPPWRWRRDVVVSSLAQHLVYVAVVAAVDGRLEGRFAPGRAATHRSPSGTGMVKPRRIIATEQ